MKIRKIANQFEDEGFDSEEQIEEKDSFQAQQELEQQKYEKSVGKSGYTYNSQIIFSLRDKLGEPIKVSTTGNGAVGWFEVDGIIYEVRVSPAAYGQYFGYFKDLQEMDRKPEIDQDDNLSM